MKQTTVSFIEISAQIPTIRGVIIGRSCASPRAATFPAERRGGRRNNTVQVAHCRSRSSRASVNKFNRSERRSQPVPERSAVAAITINIPGIQPHSRRAPAKKNRAALGGLGIVPGSRRNLFAGWIESSASARGPLKEDAAHGAARPLSHSGSLKIA